MDTNPSKQTWRDTRDVEVDLDVRPPMPDAENDALNAIETEKLDSSASSYERIAGIRERLHRSDIWVGIAVYVILAGMAFVTF